MRFLLAFILLCLTAGQGWATCTTLPFTLLPGVPPDGAQMMADLQALNDNCASGISGPNTTTAGSIAIWGNTTGTSLLNGSVVGPGTVSSPGASASFGWNGPNWASYTGNQDQLRIVTNDYPLAQEFFGGTVPVVTSLMVGLDIPASSPSAAAADQAIAGYARTNGLKGGAGTSGFGWMGGTGSSVWGLVGNVLNCGTWNCTVGIGGGGTIYGAELDMNLVNKASSVAPDLTAIGLHVVNAGVAAAGGFLHTAINIGTANAMVPWPTGINFPAGGAGIAVNIGQLATGNNHASQLFQFNSTSGGGAVKTGSLQLQPNGDLQLILPPAGFFLTGGLDASQAANNADTIFGTRFTDSSPTGFYLRFVDAANANNKFSVDVSGNIVTVGNINVSGLPASAGGGGLFVCVDTAGVFYKKATCP